MSILRFPRTRIVRDLIRLDNELEAWVAEYKTRALAPDLTPRQEERLAQRTYEIEALMERVHRAADFAAYIPPRGYETIQTGHEQRVRRLGGDRARVS